MSIDTDRFRTLLTEERRRVEHAIAGTQHTESLDDETAEIAGASDNHLGDTASATLDREIDSTLEENSQRFLAQIDAALERIAAGTYGTCTKCGRPIAEPRLEATPWAPLCIDCQREAER
ncbi:MAG: TraR/DksA family transcriptional regulator [Gaiellaceae bacterium]